VNIYGRRINNYLNYCYERVDEEYDLGRVRQDMIGILLD
jgi:hypothetical protein